MYVKFRSRDLNLDPYSPHPTSTYTCGVTARRLNSTINNEDGYFKGFNARFIYFVLAHGVGWGGVGWGDQRSNY